MRFRSRSERDRHRSSIGSNLSSTLSVSSNSTTATGGSTSPHYPASPPSIPCRSSSNADKQARFRATIAHLNKLLTSQPHAEELASSWYGTKGTPSMISGPSMSTDNGPIIPPKPRARTSSVPADRPVGPFAPPISPRGSSSRTGEPAAGLEPPHTSAPMTMTLRDLKRLLDSGRRISTGMPSVEERSLHSSAAAYGHDETDSTPAPGEAPAVQRGIPLWIVVRTLKSSWHADGSWPILACDEPWPPKGTPCSRLDKGKDREISSARCKEEPPRSLHPSSAVLRPPGITSFQVPLPPPDLTAAQACMVKADPDMDEIARRYRARGVDVEEAEKRLSVLEELAHDGENEDDSEAGPAERVSRDSFFQVRSKEPAEEHGINSSDGGQEKVARVVAPGVLREDLDGHQEDDEGEADVEADTTISAETQTHLVIDADAQEDGEKRLGSQAAEEWESPADSQQYNRHRPA